MQLAYDEALKSAARNEVPVGAVLVDGNGDVLASAGNRCVELSDPSAHAEILAMRAAGQKTANYRLVGTTLYATLEPCVMCVGAMIHARIQRLVYAAQDPKAGAVESKYTIGHDGKLNHCFKIESGLMAEECGKLLRDFFKASRYKSRGYAN